MPINLSSSIPVSLSDLHDVSIVNPQTGQYLRYSETIPAWQNAFLDSVNTTPGTWGSSNEIPVITADAQGRITSVSTISITDSQAGINTSNNTSYGVSALPVNTTGVMNTAIGTYSLLLNNTGDNNIAVGNNALASNTSGSYNTVIGNNALFANTTAFYNTAIGYGALSTSTGTTNTAIGYNAGVSMGIGNYNVIIGGSRGESIANTDNNIVISDGMGYERIFIDSTGLVSIPGSLNVTGTLTATINGGASTLTTPRNISSTGDATWVVSFNGSSDVTSGLTLSTVNLAPQTDTFRKITVNEKGLVTETSAVTSADITSALGYTPISKAGDTMIGALTVTQINGSGAGLTDIPNSALTNNTITIGSTPVTLGSSVTGLSGLTSISATTFIGSFSGTTTSATVLSTPRNISSIGDVTWSVPFDGSTDISSMATLATVNLAPQVNTFRKVTVNEKGLVTATSSIAPSDITTALGYTPVNKIGDTMIGALILNADPTLALGAATKQYVDNIATGISVHLACETGTTAPLSDCTYNNGASGVGATLTSNANISINTAGIGGYTNMVPGTRVLIKNQLLTTQNGIYVVSVVGVTGSTPWVLTRATDFDGSPATKVYAGVMMYIQEGVLTGTQWVETAIGTGMPGDYIVVGTDPIVFTQFSGAGTYSPGTGIDIASNVISNTGVTSNVAGTGIGVSSATGTVTISNTGVTSIVAGTNIAVSGSTGAVSVSVTGTVPNATTATTASTVTSAAQPAITSVGTLTGLTVTDTITGSVTGNAATATNISSGTAGQLLYQSAAGTTAKLAVATDGQWLTLAAGLPAWASAPTAAAGTLTGTTLNATVTASSLTSVGTLSNLTVLGTSTSGTFVPTSASVPVNGMYLSSANTLAWSTNSANRLTLNSTGDLSTTGNMVATTFVDTSGLTLGWKTIPQNSQSTSYTLTLADSGKHILHPASDVTARVYTLPANSSVAYPIGTSITFVNQNAAGAITISINADTMRLAGLGTTGNRTLSANGVATALKIAATEWIIFGTGIS